MLKHFNKENVPIINVKNHSIVLVLAGHGVKLASAGPHLPIGIRHLSKHPHIRLSTVFALFNS